MRILPQTGTKLNLMGATLPVGFSAARRDASHMQRPGPQHDARPVLVGRERELALSKQVLARVVTGGLHTLVLTGEPGVGKTRLAAEVAAIARERGANALHGR
jgi:transcriptional regulator with AAA-type ATPase domain